MTEILGMTAASWAVVLALSPILQARQMLHSRSSRDVSLPYLWIILVGLVLWAAYGWAAGNWYVALPNTLAVAVMAATLAVAHSLRWKPVGRYTLPPWDGQSHHASHIHIVTAKDGVIERQSIIEED